MLFSQHFPDRRHRPEIVSISTARNHLLTTQLSVSCKAVVARNSLYPNHLRYPTSKPCIEAQIDPPPLSALPASSSRPHHLGPIPHHRGLRLSRLHPAG